MIEAITYLFGTIAYVLAIGAFTRWCHIKATTSTRIRYQSAGMRRRA